MNAVETRGLCKSYGKTDALLPLDLTIPEGELFALLGVNGAGKTTAIKLLCGLTAPTAGHAALFGHDLSAQPRQAKALLGTSPQENAVAGNLTVRENLELMAGIHGASKAQAQKQAERMLAEFQLSPVAGKHAKKLSGGYQRRLSIAMALITDPKILFLDEPTLGLDVLARRELWKAVQARKGNITIVLTTHYLEEAEALADRVGILASGRLTALGTVSELLAKTGTRSLEDAFLALSGGEPA